MPLIDDDGHDEADEAEDYQRITAVLDELKELHRRGELHQLVVLANTYVPVAPRSSTIFGHVIVCQTKKHRAFVVRHLDTLVKEAKEEHRKLSAALPPASAPPCGHGTH